MDTVPPLAWQGAGRHAPQLHRICDYACRSRGCQAPGPATAAATELYLEIPVINEAGAAFCMEEVDEE